MAERTITDFARAEWLVATRRAASDLDPHSRAIDSYEATRHAAAARGHRAEPLTAGTTFSLTSRRLADSGQ